MPDSPLPEAAAAQVHVLHIGYAREAGGQEHVGGTVTLIIDGEAVIIVDPGMVASRPALLAAAAEHGIAPDAVTDVVFSHHHPDHTISAALFPAARIHDHWAIYDGDVWTSRAAERYLLSPSVRLLATPGHTSEDITTLAATPGGVYACTHAWWGPDGPAIDPLGTDQQALTASRARILAVATVIIPGHAPAFTPTPATPR
jgi:glyoxylase-like metal-dependent hydrolase (beta-lactamase superfamily II)